MNWVIGPGPRLEPFPRSLLTFSQRGFAGRPGPWQDRFFPWRSSSAALHGFVGFSSFLRRELGHREGNQVRIRSVPEVAAESPAPSSRLPGWAMSPLVHALEDAPAIRMELVR